MKKTLILLLLLSSYCGAQEGGYPGGTYSQIVASGIVTGANASVAAFTIYTPSVTGLYEVCAGEFVTTAGSTGATLEAIAVWSNPGGSVNTGLGATVTATTAGADSSGQRSSPSCQTLVSTASAIQAEYVVGGSPATNPTYTYWYTVTQK